MELMQVIQRFPHQVKDITVVVVVLAIGMFGALDQVELVVVALVVLRSQQQMD
jgi:hypothetical protein